MIKNGWLNLTEIVLVTPDEISAELSDAFDIDVNDMIIEVEYDDEGKIHRILVYVKDEKQARIIKNISDGC